MPSLLSVPPLCPLHSSSTATASAPPLQVEYVVKEKNAKILQLEQEKLVQSVKLERLKERLAQMERLGGGGGGGGSPLGGGGSTSLGGGGSGAASLTALQQKDGEMLALQTYAATQGSNPGLAGRVPGRPATHACGVLALGSGAKKVVGALQREKEELGKEKEALQLECTGLQREIRRMSEPGMSSSGMGMAGGTTLQQDQANLDQANRELAAAAEREAALGRHVT